MPEVPSFVTGFPVALAATRPAAHRALDADLRSCDALWNAHVTMNLLFPGFFAASPEERRSWTPAILEQIEWLAEGRPDSDKWLFFLRLLMSRLLFDLRENAGDGLVERLAQVAPALYDPYQPHCDGVPTLIAAALDARKTPLGPAFAADLATLVRHLAAIGDRRPHTFAIAYRLYRQGWQPQPWFQVNGEDPGWKRLLDLGAAAARGELNGHTPAQKQLAKAIGKVSVTAVAVAAIQSIRALESAQPAQLEPATLSLLRQFAAWAHANPDTVSNEALYRLCGVRWTRGPLVEDWTSALLPVVATRPLDTAFACIEQLANNPSTSGFQSVVRLYEQLATEVLREVKPSVHTGIDGFEIVTEWQALIDDLLTASAAPAKRDRPYLDVAMHHAASGYPAFLRALNERVHWLASHCPPDQPGKGRPMPWLSWCCDLGQIYCQILKEKPALDAADLAALCGVDALGWLGLAPTSPLFDLCERHIAHHGYSRELTSAIEAWRKSVHGGFAAQALRKRIGWLLWFDTTAPLNEKACWSAAIRKDLRAMPPERAASWIALLGNVSFGSAHQPTKKWLKPAEKLYAAVGADEFRTRFRTWFGGFRSDSPLKITVSGRDVLGALMWYALIAKEAKVDEAVTWFGSAKWKARADRGYTAKLLPIWLHVMTERTPERAIDAVHAAESTAQLRLDGRALEMYRELCRRFGRTPEIEPPDPARKDREQFTNSYVGKALQSLLGDSVATIPSSRPTSG